MKPKFKTGDLVHDTDGKSYELKRVSLGQGIMVTTTAEEFCKETGWPYDEWMELSVDEAQEILAMYGLSVSQRVLDVVRGYEFGYADGYTDGFVEGLKQRKSTAMRAQP